MGCHTDSVDIDLDDGAGKDDSGLFTDKCIGNGVAVPVFGYFNISVLLNMHVCIILHLVYALRKWLKGCLLDGMEMFLAAIGPLLHSGLVMFVKQLPYRFIQGFYGIKLTLAQLCIDSTVNQTHLVFHKGLLGR